MSRVFTFQTQGAVFSVALTTGRKLHKSNSSQDVAKVDLRLEADDANPTRLTQNVAVSSLRCHYGNVIKGG
jgi:hypothetical protein